MPLSHTHKKNEGKENADLTTYRSTICRARRGCLWSGRSWEAEASARSSWSLRGTRPSGDHLACRCYTQRLGAGTTNSTGDKFTTESEGMTTAHTDRTAIWPNICVGNVMPEANMNINRPFHHVSIIQKRPSLNVNISPKWHEPINADRMMLLLNCSYKCGKGWNLQFTFFSPPNLFFSKIPPPQTVEILNNTT